MLIDYGRTLEPLSGEYSKMRDAGLAMVLECQAPVFFLVEIDHGSVHIETDAPDEAAIARGFAGMLKASCHGLPISDFDSIPENLLEALGVDALLGMQRRRGLGAIYNVLKEKVKQ